MAPQKAAEVFTKQCGVLVRDRIPITVRDWNKRKGAPESEFVAERYKEGLWNDLMAHFTLPECADEAETAKLRAKVKKWTLGKMAELFRVWKKRLWAKYLEKKTPPVFDGYLAKQANHWPAFKKYKESEDALKNQQRTRKMLTRRNITINWGQGATRLPCLSGIRKRPSYLLKGSNRNGCAKDGN